jgi:hemolysin activation/secretion protein
MYNTFPFAYYRPACVAAGIALLAIPYAVWARTPPAIIPGPADSGRLHAEEIMPQQPQTLAPPISSVDQAPLIRAPKGAENVQFVLSDLQFKGIAAPLSRTQEALLEKRYADLKGKKISLQKVYEIANEITLDYRARGLLLSYAYVPNQKIASGGVRIAVVEGYVSMVELPKGDPNAALIQGYAERLYAEKPITQRTLESVLLRISDIPGRHYRAVLSRTKDMPPGASMVTLVPSEKPASVKLGVDNFGSRYLGPMQATLSYSDSFLPAQQTAITALTSLPSDELTYGMLNHYIILAPNISLEEL